MHSRPPAPPTGASGAAPAPDAPGRLPATAALRHRDFALMWWSALVSNTGGWVQNVTVPYVLYQITGQATWVGVAAFAAFFPSVLMGPLAGSLADRFSRRRILLITQVLMAVGAFALWAVWASGVRSPVLIVVLVAASGIVAGVNIPAWQAFVPDLVPRSLLMNAVTLNSAQFNAARAFGPALGGVILGSLGASWAFALNGVSFGGVIVALVLIRVTAPDRAPAKRSPIWREFAATVRYTRAHHGIWTCMVVVVALGLLGSPLFSLLVVFAEDVFEVGAGRYGLLSACLGIGAVLAAPLVASRGPSVSRGTLVGGMLVVYAAAVASFALAPTYWVGVVLLMIAGGAYLGLASTLNTTLQLQVDEGMRGRVIALYVMGLTAAIPAGGLIQGWLVELVGPRPTVAGAAALLLVFGIVLRAGSRLATMNTPGPGAGETELTAEPPDVPGPIVTPPPYPNWQRGTA